MLGLLAALVVGIVSMQSLTSVAADPTLLGQWTFDDGTATDSSGNGNNGIVNGPLPAAGHVGAGSFEFDGANDYVDLGGLDVPGSAITLAAWINSDQLTNCGASDCRILSKANGTGSQDHYIMVSTINVRRVGVLLRFRLKAGGSTETLIASAGTLSNSQWYHAAATYDGSNMRLYLDGVEVGSTAKTGAIDTNPAIPFWIGGNPDGPTSKPWDGKIDEVHLYNRVLTLGEIEDLAGLTPPPDTTPPVRSNGAPTGSLPGGTTQTTISLTTDENATCRYSTTPGTLYASMTDTFSTTGATAHSTLVGGLVDGQTFNFYVRCQDTEAVPNTNPDDFPITFSVETGPQRSNGAPTGTLPSGTTDTTISLDTSVNANCRYSTVADTPFASMTDLFTTTGGTAHSTLVSGLSDGTQFDFFVRCEDAANSASVNADDFPISFFVSNPVVDLFGHWTFDDGTGADSSGAGNNGVVNGALPAIGQIGAGSLDFDGADDYVDLGGLDIPGSGITLAGWINSDDFRNCGASDCRIFSKANGTGEQDHYIMVSTIRIRSIGTLLRFRLKAGGSTETLIASTGNLATGQWYHAAATYDGSNMRLYLDGVEVGSTAKTGAIDTNPLVPFWIGGNPDGPTSKPWDGRIDDVYLYNRALSQAEILGLPGVTPPPDEVPPLRLNAGPIGILPPGTASTTISLNTDEPANCRYSTVAGTGFASMTDLFDTTGGTSHSTLVGGLVDGGAYSYFVRCEDIAAPPTPNTDDLQIVFPVSASLDAPTPVATLVGSHPLAPAQSTDRGKQISTLFPWEGKLYMGYGDWQANTGPISVVHYDPVADLFVNEFTLDTESIQNYRGIDGKLYVPSIDPLGASVPDFGARDAAGVWTTSSPAQLIHAFDINTLTGTDLWLAGSTDPNGELHRSVDGGATWTTEQTFAPFLNFSRVYFAGVLNGSVYVEPWAGADLGSKVFDGTSWTDGPALLGPNDTGWRSEEFAGSMFFRSDQHPDLFNSLRKFDGISSQRVIDSIRDFAVVGSRMYVLAADGTIHYTEDGTSYSTFSAAPDATYRSINELNGVIYVGTSLGQLYQLTGGSLPDLSPPVRSNGAPSGALFSGTTQTTISLTTDEPATCRYSTVAGTDYSLMTDTFGVTGGTAHSSLITGLVDGQSYDFFVRCQDTEAVPNTNTNDFPISFSIEVGPHRSNGAPSGALPAGTLQTTISLDTHIAANCRYSTVADTPFASMTDLFTTTGGTAHSTLITGLTDGTSFDFFVRCEDAGDPANVNVDDFPISFSVAAPVTDLIGQWRFDDGTATDSSGSGNHGVVNGAVPAIAKIGAGSLDFDGIDDHVDLGGLDIAEAGTGLPISAFTATAWINPDSFSGCSSSDCRILSKADGLAENDHYVMISTLKVETDIRLRFRLKAGGSTETLIATSGDLQTGEWTHVAAVYDGANMSLFVNGLPVGSIAKTGVIDVNPALDMWIGGSPTAATDKPWDGRIDEVHLFDRALSQMEIQTVAGNLAPIGAITATPPRGGLVPLIVDFDGSGSVDPDGNIVSYSWDFGDGSPGDTGVAVQHTYTVEGNYTAILTVTDDDGASSDTEYPIIAGPLADELLIFDWNEAVTTGDEGFATEKPPMLSANGDWTPYGFDQGTLYARIEIRSQPVAQNMQLQFCVWQDFPPPDHLETCMARKSLTGNPGTVVTTSQAISDMWMKDGLPIDWSRARDMYGVAVKCSNGTPVSPRQGWNWCGFDPNDWYPLDMRYTVVVVAAGGTFDGWDNYIP